jgi:DNA-binding transcriptional MerR regulator
MDLFSISDMQKYSGIKAHTIRIWEKRYDALKPGRSEGSTRHYDGTQLRRLLNIVSLMNTEYKVSELCSMPDQKLNKLLDEQLTKSISANDAYEYFISQIIAAAMEFDEIMFDKLFSNCMLRFGVKGTYINVIYPSLVRVGCMWSKDSIHPSQEHFITNLLKQKLLAAIDALPPPTSKKNTWLLFLAEDEFHEFGLLLASYLIRQSGKKVIYLGANVPFDSLKYSVKQTKSGNLLFFLIHKNNIEEENKYIINLCKSFPSLNIYLACDSSRLKDLKAAGNLVLLHSVQDLENELIK